MHTETELKYFIPGNILDKYIKLKDYKSKLIFQAYFSRELIFQKLLPLLKFKLPIDFDIEKIEIKNGRVRSIEFEAKKKYFVTIKSPMQNDLSRLELESEITQEQFEELYKVSDAGSISKRRYYVPGTVKFKDKSIDLTAEIDQLLLVNKLQIEDAFYTIDVELPESLSVLDFRASTSSFVFLGKSLELSGKDIVLRKLLGMRYLAKHGYSMETSAEVNKTARFMIKN